MYFYCIMFKFIRNTAFDGLVRNFKVASQNSTHVTFSWDMHSSYTENINYFRIYYRYAFPGYNPYGYSTYYQFSISQTTQINGGLTFLFTTSVTTFNNIAQYIMWLYVSLGTSPNSLYSEQIYAEIGKKIAIINKNINIDIEHCSWLKCMTCKSMPFHHTCRLSLSTTNVNACIRL